MTAAVLDLYRLLASIIIPLPTIIATWPSHTARPPSRSAYARGARPVWFPVLRKVLAALAFGIVADLPALTLGQVGRTCYFFTLAATWTMPPQDKRGRGKRLRQQPRPAAAAPTIIPAAVGETDKSCI